MKRTYSDHNALMTKLVSSGFKQFPINYIDELSRINLLDSFQHDHTSMKSYLNKLESAHSSPIKFFGSQRKMGRLNRFDDSADFPSSEKVSCSPINTVKKRKHNLVSESQSSLKLTSLRPKQSRGLQRTSSKYLQNLQRKF